MSSGKNGDDDNVTQKCYIIHLHYSDHHHNSDGDGDGDGDDGDDDDDDYDDYYCVFTRIITMTIIVNA